MNRSISTFILALAALLATVGAECPNACSAHGKCGAYDMCTCFRNWMSNDCSERICQFGLAHVDTPKGDLDASAGPLSGPDTVVIQNDAVYPYGTTEQYPAVRDIDGNILQNTAHEYRECSNKGICDRSTGNCACFEGYEGSACQRASCPSNANGVCSGHGTCENIKEIAERDYGNVYKLWDDETTLGCVCDGGFEGPDCSQKKCKYGVDPYYTDNRRHVRYAHYTIDFYTLDFTSTVSGNYSLVFFDSFGEDWQTEAISWNAECTEVVSALEGLPNDVIPLDSVRCVKTAYSSYVAANTILAALGGTYDDSWSKRLSYTLSFPENPGKLRQIEINKFLDGTRPTLFTSETTSTLGYKIYPNGVTGDDVDMVPDRCEDVEVELVYSNAYTHTLALSDAEKILLKRCLGDSDGDSTNNQDVYDWDHGSALGGYYNVPTNPHLIKLQDASQYLSSIRSDINGDADYDPTLATNPSTTLCNPNKIDAQKFGAGRCSNRNPPGFYALLWYHSGSDEFRLISNAQLLSANFDTDTHFYVYTTTGHLQLVNGYAGAYNIIEDYTAAQMVEYGYTNVMKSINLDPSATTFTGDISCENSVIGTNGALDCLNKNDYVIFASARQVASAGTFNPVFPNIYQVKKISKEPLVTDAVLNTHSERQKITLDYSVNGLFYRTDSAADASWSVADVYKFYPPANADGGYRFAAPCSNRGICNGDTGICECFSGFTDDNCACINALAK